MIFPSYIFLFVFLPTVLAFWYGISKTKYRVLFLTFASYVFYAWWDYRFCLLLLGSTVLDFLVGKKIFNSPTTSQKKKWLALSLIGNLGVLGIFKYYDFFVESLVSLVSLTGITLNPVLLNITLPLGISFYTFQSLSYSIDIYKGKCKPTNSFSKFACYVSMFPQLVAGPIVRYSDVENQLKLLDTYKTTSKQFADGIWFLVIGLSKKVLIADALAPIANATFDTTNSIQFYSAWIGTLAYTFQLYFDFSGYSDMARGLGKMLGFEFPINFNSPYKAISISDFWNRWHITLSSWLRDYLYIPLGGSRNGTIKTLRNLFITLFLGGLWHGAGLTFIAWGIFHGVLLVLNTIHTKMTKFKFHNLINWAITFLFINIGWVLFRSPNISKAIDMYKSMIGYYGFEHFENIVLKQLTIPVPEIGFHIRLLGLPIAMIIAFAMPNSQEIHKNMSVKNAIILAILMSIVISKLSVETPFLYFQF